MLGGHGSQKEEDDKDGEGKRGPRGKNVQPAQLSEEKIRENAKLKKKLGDLAGDKSLSAPAREALQGEYNKRFGSKDKGKKAADKGQQKAIGAGASDKDAKGAGDEAGSPRSPVESANQSPREEDPAAETQEVVNEHHHIHTHAQDVLEANRQED